MKKLFLIILLLLFTGCASRNDYYVLKSNDQSVVVGYDKAQDYFDDEEMIDALDTVDKELNIENFYCLLRFKNNNKKEIELKKAELVYLDLYIDDNNGADYYLDDYLLSKDIYVDCTNLNGTLITKNGIACVLEKQVDNKLNVVVLHNDLLTIDESKVKRIEIYVE